MNSAVSRTFADDPVARLGFDAAGIVRAQEPNRRSVRTHQEPGRDPFQSAVPAPTILSARRLSNIALRGRCTMFKRVERTTVDDGAILSLPVDFAPYLSLTVSFLHAPWQQTLSIGGNFLDELGHPP